MSKKLTTEEFIVKAINCHEENANDYSDTIYTGTYEEVIIKCNRCGMPYSQIAHYHLLGRQCPSCAGKNYGVEDFIKDAIEIHTIKYGYDEVVYIETHTKVKIICYTHGPFWQTPHNHNSGKQDCPQCMREMSRVVSGLNSGFLNLKNMNKNPEMANIEKYLYLIQFSSFIKIGLGTEKRIKSHLTKRNNGVLLRKYVGKQINVFLLEKEIKIKFKEDRYVPTHEELTRHGKYECFVLEVKEDIEEYLESKYQEFQLEKIV